MVCQLPPIQAGMRTEWPRLETGNSSVTPWTRAITNACRYDTSDPHKARRQDASRPAGLRLPDGRVPVARETAITIGFVARVTHILRTNGKTSRRALLTRTGPGGSGRERSLGMLSSVAARAGEVSPCPGE